MTCEALRNWALVAVSLFNTVLLLWLGLTVWLNAERRAWGLALASGGFLLGALFFVIHSALLLSPAWQLTRTNTLLLAAGMAPVLLLPYVWYLVLLWYGGYWAPDGGLRTRHRPWLAVTSAVLVVGFAALVLLAIPYLPVLHRLTPFILPLRDFFRMPVFRIPLVAIGYPLYVVLCVALSLDALRRPESARAALQDVARRRARPWLIAATALLLLVGLLVAVAVVWIITNTKEGSYYILRRDDIAAIAGFDLLIASLIGASSVMLGSAITGYELFMGRMLPRRELARQWRWALLLASGYALLLGGALAAGLEPVYAVLSTALLMTLFFALIGWRSHLQWRDAMRQMRPFVRSQGWFERLTGDSRDADPGGSRDALATLCAEVLNAPLAYLIPAGALASFVPAQSFPPGRTAPPAAAATWLRDGEWHGSELAISVDLGESGGAAWAVPLASEQGPAGILILGDRRDGSLYSEEELEIARAAGERLIDLAAGVVLSRRLMQLQRERMVATQLADQRTRRVLHDEVLPLIHTAILALPPEAASGAAAQRMAEAHRGVSALLRELPATTPAVAQLGPLGALRRAIEGEFAGAFHAVSWNCTQESDLAAKELTPVQAETVYYAARELVRNAAKHARPAEGSAPRLTISGSYQDGSLDLTVEDDGAGLAAGEARGHGLELHTTLMAIVGGVLIVEPGPEGGTRGILKVAM